MTPFKGTNRITSPYSWRSRACPPRWYTSASYTEGGGRYDDACNQA